MESRITGTMSMILAAGNEAGWVRASGKRQARWTCMVGSDKGGTGPWSLVPGPYHYRMYESMGRKQ